jgi:hypothetical protein
MAAPWRRRGALGGIAALVVAPVSHHFYRGPAYAAASTASAHGGAGLAVVPLASSVAAPNLPTTVLVHGLDSCRETWVGVLADLSQVHPP